MRLEELEGEHGAAGPDPLGELEERLLRELERVVVADQGDVGGSHRSHELAEGDHLGVDVGEVGLVGGLVAGEVRSEHLLVGADPLTVAVVEVPLEADQGPAVIAGCRGDAGAARSQREAPGIPVVVVAPARGTAWRRSRLGCSGLRCTVWVAAT